MTNSNTATTSMVSIASVGKFVAKFLSRANPGEILANLFGMSGGVAYA